MNNNNYYPNGYFSNNEFLVPQQGTNPNQNLPLETTIISPSTHPEYAENIFLLNLGKNVRVYFSYPDSVQWRDRVFEGTIIDAGRDYLILRNQNGENFLLWLVYINYAIFDQEITHNYPRPLNQNR